MLPTRDTQKNLLERHLGPAILDWEEGSREWSLTVSRQGIYEILSFLKSNVSFRFNQLIDVCGVDYLGKRPLRFDVVYHLLSLPHNQRIRLKVPLNEGESVESATPLFASANWWEREAYDMFGIVFENHPDLRRILTDYGFEGFPLRKDFPLSGHVEVRYDAEERKVVYEPVNLPQAFRSFESHNPWKGMVKPEPSQLGDA
jgi:NADH-quinone oxidoreductase subunit C